MKVLEDYVLIEADKNIADKWAAVRYESVRTGKQISSSDAWIAATALAYSIPLITNNHKDFKNIASLKLISKT